MIEPTSNNSNSNIQGHQNIEPLEICSRKLTPFVYWAQDREHIYLRVEIGYAKVTTNLIIYNASIPIFGWVLSIRNHQLGTSFTSHSILFVAISHKYACTQRCAKLVLHALEPNQKAMVIKNQGIERFKY